MNRSLYIAATGMNAQQSQMDVISNNLANVSTNGFKGSRAVFEDLLYQTVRQPGANSTQQTELASGSQLGTGVQQVATERLYTQGNLQQTGNSKDVAINGQGFFQVQMPDGTTAYTRDGSFQTNAQGQLVTSSGYQVNPAITIPQNATSITIGTRRHGLDHAAGQTANVTGRRDPARDLHQPGRPRCARREPVLRDRFVGRAERHATGPERRRHAAAGLCGSVERQRRAGTGQHDPDPARVRNQQQGRDHLRPDAADAFADAGLRLRFEPRTTARPDGP